MDSQHSLLVQPVLQRWSMHHVTRALAMAIPAALVLSPSSARAEPVPGASPAPADTAAEAAALRVDVGLFSPIGSLGLVYARPVHPLFALELGGGLGFSGVQLSAMTKLRLGGERTRFTPGVGLSVGLPLLGTSAVHEGHPPHDDEMEGPAVTMVWLDVDALGVEHRTRSGVVLSASAGITVALTKGHWDAIDLGDDIAALDVLPQFRLGVGKAF